MLGAPKDTEAAGNSARPVDNKVRLSAVEEERRTFMPFRPTSYIETLIHLLKGNIGSGMMAMGYAFAQGGLILAPVLTLFLALICIHSQHILVVSATTIRVRMGMEHTPNFATTVQFAFETGPPKLQKYAPHLKRYVHFTLCITQLGFCCVYFVFVANSTLKALEFFDITYETRNGYMICISSILVPIMLTCWIRDLKYLVPFSIVANILMAFGITATLYLMSSELTWEEVSERPYVAPYYKVPLFLGATIYSFEGISLVLPLQRQMKEERYFGNSYGVLNVGMSIVTSLLIAVGTVGFLRYGDEALGSLTLNLPQDQILPLCVNISIALGVLFTFALMMHVPVIIVWPAIRNKWGPFKYPILLETFIRSLLVLITYALAAIVPYLELIIALVGAFCSTSLALLIPAMLEVVVKWDGGISKFTIVKDAFIFSVGIIAFITGTGISLYEIYGAFVTEHDLD